MADTPNSALGTNEKMDDTDIALVKAMYCGKFNYFTLNYFSQCRYFVCMTCINHVCCILL